MPDSRKRLRELGYRVGRFEPGARGALVDVPGVRVGHLTLAEGGAIRTGVTAVLPHAGNVYAEKVLAACHVVNGYGKATGLTQLEELGTLESPVLLTGTLAVGAVWQGALRDALDRNPEVGRRDTVNVVVAECFDGWLSDARALAVRPEHAVEAIARASETETSAGSVGGGAGTTSFGFKSGVGQASRIAERNPALRLGCLALSNFGAPRDLHMLVGAGAAAAHRGDEPTQPPVRAGSAVVVLATDAPLSERQLGRLAARGTLGLGRAGSFASNASGEYVIAFSTAHRVPHKAEHPTQELIFLRDDSVELRQLFEMAGEATHEAVLDSLCAADTTTGRDGNRAEALPYELLERAPRLERAG